MTEEQKHRIAEAVADAAWRVVIFTALYAVFAGILRWLEADGAYWFGAGAACFHIAWGRK